MSETKIDTEALDQVLSPYGPYPLHEVLKYLIEATDILLHKHGYDGHGWVGLEYAWRQANLIYPHANKALVEYQELKVKLPQFNTKPECICIELGYPTCNTCGRGLL